MMSSVKMDERQMWWDVMETVLVAAMGVKVTFQFTSSLWRC